MIARIALIGVLLSTATAVGAAKADAHLIAKPKDKTLRAQLASQQKNLAHVRYVCNNGAGDHKRFACPWVKILHREIADTTAAMRPSKMDLAWRWYRSSATQCVVDHEGGWRSRGPTAYDGSYYAGRFQKDASFERETAFGRRMQNRYGRSDNWPPWAQVFQAYEVWDYAGWSRWPTYARYCA